MVGGDEVVIHGIRRDESRGGAVNLDLEAREETCLVKIESLDPAADATACVGQQYRISPMSDQMGRPHRASVHILERHR